MAEVGCECTELFEVPDSLKGGITNCPRCGKAVPVPGGPEPLFIILVTAGVLLILGVSSLMWAAVGPTAGLVSLLLGAGVLAAIVLAS